MSEDEKDFKGVRPSFVIWDEVYMDEGTTVPWEDSPKQETREEQIAREKLDPNIIKPSTKCPIFMELSITDDGLFGPITIVKNPIIPEEPVPFKDKPGGITIGEARLHRDGDKIIASIEIDPDSPMGQQLQNPLMSGFSLKPENPVVPETEFKGNYKFKLSDLEEDRNEES